MLKIVPFATAVAAVSAVCYLVGVLIMAVAPGIFMALMQSWFLLNLAGIGVLLTLPGFIVGLVTIAVWSWLLGAAVAALYNLLSQGETARV